MISPASDVRPEPEHPCGNPAGRALAWLGSSHHVERYKGYVRLRLLLVSIDFVASFAAWTLVLQTARSWALTPDLGRTPVVLTTVICSAVTVIVLWTHRLYRARVCAVRTVEVSRIAGTALLACLVAASLHGFARFGPPLAVDEVAAAMSFVFLVSCRLAYSTWLRTCRARGRFCRPVCIIGDNDEAKRLVEIFSDQPELGYRVLAVLGKPDEWSLQKSHVPAIDHRTDVAAATRRVGASGVVIAVSAIEPDQLEPLVRQLVHSGLHVQISTGLARIGHRRMRPSPVSHQLLYYVEHPNLSPWQCLAKRTIDVLGATCILVMAAPILAVSAVAIKLDDRGPVLYRQQRVGRGGKLFKVVKLRTMVPDASEQRAQLVALNERTGPLFKLSRDPRVTRVGRFLRASSIDELPQLFNVIRGEMSLVGPRPALPEEVVQFDIELLDRASVPPGITGLWQISARDNPSFDTYRRLDLYYVDNWSVMMDVSIICSTVGVVIGRALKSFQSGSEMAAPPQIHQVGAPETR